MENKNNNNFLQDNNFIEFVNYRKIEEGDFYIFDELKNFSKNLFLQYHNYFNLLKDRAFGEIEKDILLLSKDLLKQINFNNQEEIEKLKIRIRFLELYKILCEKYGWEVCYQSNRFFEKIV